MLAVETRGLTKEFLPGVGVVDLDLTVRRGEVYGFLGPNGAGKSTAIRLLTGILLPDRGEVAVLGLHPRRDEAALHARIGVLVEPVFARHHSGRSLVELQRRLRDDGEIPRRADVLAERLGLDLDRRAHELSLGNRQKLGLVLAMAHEPELLVLDEPSNGLDPLLQRELEVMLREVADAGRTVLLSSHTLPEVERIADTVGFIRRARLVEQAPLTSLAARALRRATFTFEGRPPPVSVFTTLDGVVEAFADEAGVTVTWQGTVAEVLGVAADHRAETIEARGVDLEATFLALYEEPSPAVGP